MTGFLTIKNWAEFQHYKDRNPPWIKLHRALLDDYDFSRLHDASKLHLMLIWLLGSQSDGRIPDDPRFLQAKLSLDKQPDLQPLVDSGFLIPEQDASNLHPPDASNKLALARSREERREEERRLFAEFWLAYPKRVAKPDALKEWKKLNLANGDCERVMQALERFKGSGQWQQEGGRYIPHPATWLKKRRFDDEPAAAAIGSFPL